MSRNTFAPKGNEGPTRIFVTASGGEPGAARRWGRYVAALLLALVALPALAADARAPVLPGLQDDLAEMARRGTEDLPALAGHEPVYFVVGRRHDTSARFQFSFRYRMFDDDGVVVRWLRPLAGMHIAYTQTSLWDLSDDSKPFRDTSYKPSILWHWRGGPRVGQRYGWQLDAGFEHESNGRDTELSRSINIAFLKPEYRRYISARRYAGIGVKAYRYIDREENPDISDYRGYADWQFLLGRDDGWLLRTTIRRGSARHGSIQTELSYPLRRQIFADTGGYIFLQHFNGYGETLLDYDVRRDAQLRFGFAIVR
jgi:outer membrane phospholipase A